MTGPLAVLFAQVLEALQPLGSNGTQRANARAALSSIERHVQDMRNEVDRQLGRHLCYTSESSRERFWSAVDAALPAREKEEE